MLFDSRKVDPLIDDLPSPLCTARARARLKATTRLFPHRPPWTTVASRAGVVGLEFRLAAKSEQVDLAVPVTADDAETMVRLWDDPVDSWLRVHSRLSNLMEFFRFWHTAEAAKTLTDSRLAWIELDVDPAGTPNHLPIKVFVQLKNAAHWPPALAGSWLSTYFESVFAKLTGSGPPT